MKFTLGFSPCPNDTFIFYAMVHERIDMEDLQFEPVIADVEQLNRKALQAELDVTKLSFNALGYVLDHYRLLGAGAALGRNCGPLLISKDEAVDFENKLPNLQIGIPGKMTTANALMTLAFPGASHKKEMLFSDIEDALLSGEIDAGVIIHENRFTYEAKGLIKWRDLGEFWEESTGLPIPLGGIAVNHKLDDDLAVKVNRVLRRSVEYAFANRDETKEYVARYSQEMSEEVMYQHIDLYVNEFSVDLGEEGREAVRVFFEKAGQGGTLANSSDLIFVEG